MDIELTPYGRYLLSIGKLKPKYYDFSDEDVLYDTQAANRSEDQEQSHNRIVNETPRLKTLYLKQGVQSESENDYGQTGSIDLSIDVIREEFELESHNQKFLYCLGRSSYKTEKTPGFQVTMLRGHITSSVNYLKKQYIVDSLNIPQIEMEFILTATTASQLTDPSENYTFTSDVRPDGTYVKLEFEEPIIHLKEFNSFYEKENYDIEVFVENKARYGGAYVGEKIRLEPLKFSRENSSIINDLLVFEETTYNGIVPLENQTGDEPTVDMVSHFFDIIVDEQIPQEELCELVDSLEVNNQFLDDELICPDQRTERFDIYSSRVRPSDLEDCD